MKILIRRIAIPRKIAGITHTGACVYATEMSCPVWFADWLVIEYTPAVGVFCCIVAAAATKLTATVTITANKKNGDFAIAHL